MKRRVVLPQTKFQMVECEAGGAADRPPALLLNINVAYQVLFYPSQSQSSRVFPCPHYLTAARKHEIRAAARVRVSSPVKMFSPADPRVLKERTAS